MLYDSRPLYRRPEPRRYFNRTFLLEVLIVLMCPILLFMAVIVFGYSEVFYFRESGPIEAFALLAP
jgi:hypothetical protein